MISESNVCKIPAYTKLFSFPAEFLKPLVNCKYSYGEREVAFNKHYNMALLLQSIPADYYGTEHTLRNSTLMHSFQKIFL